MLRFVLFLAMYSAMFLVSQAQADVTTGATSLGDLTTYPETRDSRPRQLTAVGDRVFFTARHQSSGREIWVSDGTSDGTFLLKDVNPGLDDSTPESLSELDGQLVFTAVRSIRGLWVSDGTSAGTRLITDGVRHTQLDVGEIIVVDDYVYMRAHEEHTGSEVWRYSLRNDELIQVADIVPGRGSSDPEIFTMVAGRLIFNTAVGMHVTDPDVPGAQRFEPPDAEGLRFSNSRPVVEYKNQLYFQASTPAYGKELWRTDGTAEGTELVMNLGGTPEDSSPDFLVVHNGFLYFVAEPRDLGSMLFFTDGTRYGTQLLHPDFGGEEQTTSYDTLPLLPNSMEAKRYGLSPQAQGPEDTNDSRTETPWPRHILQVSVVNGVMYFLGEYFSGDLLLWRSDGTVEGSVALRIPRNIVSFNYISLPFAFQDQQLLFANSSEHLTQLWQIVDGKSIEPVAKAGLLEYRSNGHFAVTNDRLYFPGSTPEMGWELWGTQESPDSARQIANINPDDSADSDATLLSEGPNGALFIGPASTARGDAIWRTNGTPDTTVRLHEFKAPTDPDYDWWSLVYASHLLQLDSRAVFTLTTYISNPVAFQEEEWAVDGDDVFKIGDQSLEFPIRFGGQALATRSGNLWATDGQQGSVDLITMTNGGGASYPWEFTTASDNYVWFFSEYSGVGTSVWRSDGTKGGATLIDNDPDGTAATRYFPLGSIGDDFYYLSAGHIIGVKIWRAGDQGITLLGTLTQWLGSSSDILHVPTARMGNKFLLHMDLPERAGRGLFVTDGTPDGTRRLKVIAPSGNDAFSNIVVLGGYAYFYGYDDTHGRTLWKSDGTEEGTGSALDLGPNSTVSHSAGLTVHNDAIYMVVKSTESGEEIWKTDGTRAVQVTELLPGSLSAGPTLLQSVGGRLYFYAWIPGQGRELMILDE